LGGGGGIFSLATICCDVSGGKFRLTTQLRVVVVVCVVVVLRAGQAADADDAAAALHTTIDATTTAVQAKARIVAPLFDRDSILLHTKILESESQMLRASTGRGGVKHAGGGSTGDCGG
jgi:hypothetical protein